MDISTAADTNFLEIFSPVFGSGVIFAGVFLFLYVVLRDKDIKYKAIFFLSITSFIFVFAEAMIIFSTFLWQDAVLAKNFHRIEQLSGSMFLFTVPYFLSVYLNLSDKWRKFLRYFSYAGLTYTIICIVFAFIMPDTFISIDTNQIVHGKTIFGRGKEGFLYAIRDIILAIMMIISITSLIKEIRVHRKNARYIIPILIGISIAIISAIDDTIYVHFQFYIGLLPHINFSRFSLGITIFTISVMASLIIHFLDQTDTLQDTFNALNSSEQKFIQIASNITEVFWLIEYDTTKKRSELIYVNDALELIWNIKKDFLYKNPASWLHNVHEDDLYYVEKMLDDVTEGQSYEIQYRIIDKHKNIKWLNDKYTLIPEGTTETLKRYVRITQDITDKKLIEEELEYLAFFDPLTGLMNRKSFHEKLNDSLKQAKRSLHEKIRGLLFIDLDNFKDINDSLGHDIGDELLKIVAIKIKKVLRETDYIFRFGGDEFAIILTNLTDYSDAGIVAQKIITSLSDPFYLSGHKLYIWLSIGISLFPQDGDNIKLLIKKADTALFEAKKEKNIYKYYTKSMEEKAIEKVKLITNLKNAIDNNEFELYFQPIVDFTGKILGAETLIRWKTQNGEMIPPDKFIPTAEDTMLIIPIGEWVLNEACIKWKELSKHYKNDLFLSINLSVKQFMEKDIVDKIKNIITENHIQPELIHLEITESSLMENITSTLNKLNQIRNLGIKISIDDFGTGYSSLSYLEKFPINTIKIDRSFIMNIPFQQKTSPLVEAIIIMAKNLGHEIIVEGIEEKEQIKYLKTLNYPYGIALQGFYFSKPLPYDDFFEFIAKNL